MNHKPIAVFIPAPPEHEEWERRFTLNWIDGEPLGITHLYSEDLVRQQQAEIERLTTKNLEWLANWNEQQAEIEALKKSINEALASIPAYGEQGFYFEHHDINGEYLGHSSIHAEDVVQRIEAILRKASEK